MGDGDGTGRNYPLPGGVSLDAVACSLIAHAVEIDGPAESVDSAPRLEDDLAEIAQLLRTLVDHAPPDGDVARRN